MTHDEVRKRAKDEGIEFFLAQFVEMHGKPNAKLMPVQAIDDLLEEGAGFAGFAAGPIGQTPASPDMLAVPDTSTYTRVPWQPELVRFACDVTVEGEPWPYCPRTILRGAVERAAKLGFRLKMGLEAEFFLVRKDEDGRLLVDDPLDTSEQPCYDAKALYRNYEFLTTLSRYANELGYGNYANDHEDANGQFESNFTYDDALVTCDRAIFFRYMVHVMAQQRGKLATFMPKPFGHLTGNGCHFHLSLWDKTGKKNLFEAAKDPNGYGLSEDAYHFIGGLIQHADAVSAIVAPTVNSYKRIGVGAPDSGATWSPAYAAWGGNNRTQMIRVPGGPRIEHRGIDGSANPYLAATAILAAGLDGIERKLDPGAQNTANLYTASPQEIRRKRIKSLPSTLVEATVRAAQGHRAARLVRPYGQRALQRLLRRHEAARVPGVALARVAVGGRALPDALLGPVEHLIHSDDTRFERQTVKGSDIDALWQDLGRAAGSVDIGLRRIRIEPGKRPTPAHDHGAEEEIFYVLAGSGLSWRAGETHAVRAGDCLVYRPEAGAHTIVAGNEPLDVLAFGERRMAEVTHLPHAGVLWAGSAWVADAVAGGHPWEREAKAGQAEAAGAGLAAARLDRAPRRRAGRGRRPPGRRYRCRRLGVAAGGVTSGLRHVAIAPDHHGWPRHCHAAEEELFVILSGAGTVRIGDEEADVRAGHVVSRPSGTRDRARFRAGPGGARVPLLRPAREQRHRLLPRFQQVLPRRASA